MSVLAASYPLLIMTPWVFDTKARDTAGWCIVILIIGNILFNIGIVIVIFIKDTSKKCKFYCMKRQIRK